MICPEDGCGALMDQREDDEGTFYLCPECGAYFDGELTA